MSFIRPELAAAFARWREPIVWGGVIVLGVAAVWRGLALGGPLLVVAGLLIAGLGLGLFIGALRRRAFRAETAGPGVVAIDEGRIGYLGPKDGGYVDLPTLVEVAITGGPGARDRAWLLRAEDGTRLVIPFGALGAERLPDALAALPGFDLGPGAAAPGLAHPGRVALWRRDPVRPAIDPLRRP